MSHESENSATSSASTPQPSSQEDTNLETSTPNRDDFHSKQDKSDNHDQKATVASELTSTEEERKERDVSKEIQNGNDDSNKDLDEGKAETLNKTEEVHREGEGITDFQGELESPMSTFNGGCNMSESDDEKKEIGNHNTQDKEKHECYKQETTSKYSKFDYEGFKTTEHIEEIVELLNEIVPIIHENATNSFVSLNNRLKNLGEENIDLGKFNGYVKRNGFVPPCYQGKYHFEKAIKDYAKTMTSYAGETMFHILDAMKNYVLLAVKEREQMQNKLEVYWNKRYPGIENQITEELKRVRLETEEFNSYSSMFCENSEFYPILEDDDGKDDNRKKVEDEDLYTSSTIPTHDARIYLALRKYYLEMRVTFIKRVVSIYQVVIMKEFYKDFIKKFETDSIFGAAYNKYKVT